MSSSLLWECIKGNNSFIRKSVNMPIMSREPGNLMGLHSFKFSGLANSKVLDVSSKKVGSKEKIMLTTHHKKGSRVHRPGSILLAAGLSKSTKKGLQQVTKATEGSFNRRDLMELAKIKFQKVKTSFKKKKLVFKSRRATK
mmetsp:Transcript_50834/g.129106  ORF Transcript_50834/g.129106 Transcript_50834/m.129106 type:complete len:141 (-) Transcript_50834:68-490(-)